jgi:apolipoprotein N-acyltransferase
VISTFVHDHHREADYASLVNEFAVEAPQALATPHGVDGPRDAKASEPALTARRPTGSIGAAVPLAAAVAAAAAAGVALALAFPSTGWWPLAMVSVAVLTLLVRGRRPRRAFVLGLVYGLAFTLPHLHWSGVYVGLLPWAALSTLEALYIAVMAALTPLAWRVPGGRAGTVMAITGLWVTQEALRARTPFGGFPWARIAFSQADAPTLGYAALGGAPLVSAAVAAVGACLAVAAVLVLSRSMLARPRSMLARRGSRRSLPSADLVTAAIALLAAVTVLAGGSLVPRPTSATRFAQVAAVQGNVPEAGLEFNAQRRAVLDNHVRTTFRLAADVRAGRVPKPDVVVWPENSSDIDPLRNADAYGLISQATDAIGVPILVGAVLQEPVGYVSNASLLWGPDGSAAPGPGARYVKRHPAPFAEYIPYRSFFRMFSDKVDLVMTDFTAGHTVGVLPAGPARLGDIICFEVAYDDLVRDTVVNGADLLTVQTNNATFGYTDESVQQLAMSRLRAVESGRSVVHISTVGVSALITPDGRMVTTSGHFTQQVLQARLPLRTERTIATAVGVLPEILIALAGVVLVGLGWWTGRRAARNGSPASAAAPSAMLASSGVTSSGVTSSGVTSSGEGSGAGAPIGDAGSSGGTVAGGAAERERPMDQEPDRRPHPEEEADGADGSDGRG